MPDFELKAWIDSLGLTADESAQMTAILTPKVDVVKKTVMTQSDYSRNMDELKRLRGEIEKKDKFLDSEVARFAKWEGDVKGKVATVEAQVEAERARAAALETQLKKAAEDYGFDATIPAAAAPAKEQAKTADVDTSRFITTDKLNEELREYPLISAVVHDVAVQHQKLFGAPLENASEIVAESIKSKRSIEVVWAEKHNVAQKRKDLQEAEIQARINKGIEEGVIKRMSEQRTSPLPGVPGSPILERKFEPAKERAINDPRRGVTAAIQSFQTTRVGG